jgi:hypothetical protein
MWDKPGIQFLFGALRSFSAEVVRAAVQEPLLEGRGLLAIGIQ